MCPQRVFLGSKEQILLIIVESNNDQEYLLFAPEEYTLWTQEVERVSAELKANTPKKTTAKTQTKSKTRPQTTAKSGKATQSTTSEPSLFDFVNEDTTLKPQPIAEVKQIFDASHAEAIASAVRRLNASTYLPKITSAPTDAGTIALRLQHTFNTNRYEGPIYQTKNLQDRTLAQIAPTDSARTKVREQIEAEIRFY